jgi:uncharacterized membrane protein YtjA (UPF0391 family)
MDFHRLASHGGSDRRDCEGGPKIPKRSRSSAGLWSIPVTAVQFTLIEKGILMLSWALIFLVVAVVAAVLGFWGLAGTAAWVAKVLFVVFLIIFVLSLLLGQRTV